MFIFMLIVTFLCVYIPLVMAYIGFLFIIEVFFTNDTETTKDMPIDRTH